MRRTSTQISLLASSFLLGFFLPMLTFGVMAQFDLGPFAEEEASFPSEAYLEEEEVVIVPSRDEEALLTFPVAKVVFEYIEVVDSCGPHFEGACVRVRSGPGEDYPAVARLRKGVVLKVGGKVERNERTWYKIVFNEWVRYPNRIRGDWYVAAEFVQILLDEGERGLEHAPLASSTKRIVVERKKQQLFAYDGDTLFMEAKISTGMLITPTPRGTFSVFRKMPTRYMQGPIPDIAEQYYDLPGVPWNLYFTEAGGAIHGAYWHDKFGRAYSHGCVNLPPEKAKELYLWADIGTQVVVRD